MNQPLIWNKAPIKTVWGDCMVEATIAITKDNCASIYIEKEMIPLIEQILSVKEMINRHL